jgi:hypothetical protein
MSTPAPTLVRSPHARQAPNTRRALEVPNE